MFLTHSFFAEKVTRFVEVLRACSPIYIHPYISADVAHVRMRWGKRKRNCILCVQAPDNCTETCVYIMGRCYSITGIRCTTVYIPSRSGPLLLSPLENFSEGALVLFEDTYVVPGPPSENSRGRTPLYHLGVLRGHSSTLRIRIIGCADPMHWLLPGPHSWAPAR
jgi:hypothetical protein